VLSFRGLLQKHNRGKLTTVEMWEKYSQNREKRKEGVDKVRKGEIGKGGPKKRVQEETGGGERGWGGGGEKKKERKAKEIGSILKGKRGQGGLSNTCPSLAAVDL